MAILSQDQPRVCGDPPKRQQADPKLPPGRNFCKCSACGDYFSTVRAFDLHRVGNHRVPGDRRCRTFAGMESKGLRLNPKGYWTRIYTSDAGICTGRKAVA